MAHLTPVRTLWPRGYVTTGQNMRDIDANSVKAINGDEGGDYTPSAPVIIGGAGVVVASQWVWSAGAGVTVDGTSSKIRFAKNETDDAFRFGGAHADVAREPLTKLCQVQTERPEDITGTTHVRTRVAGTRFSFPIRVIGGGTLYEVVFQFAVGAAHANVPETLPQFRVIAVDKDGNITLLRAPDALIGPDGFVEVEPRPATGVLWYNGGVARSFTYPCNQNNVVDLAKYSYFAEIIDEQGANAFSSVTTGNYFLSALARHNAIALLAQRQ